MVKAAASGMLLNRDQTLMIMSSRTGKIILLARRKVLLEAGPRASGCLSHQLSRPCCGICYERGTELLRNWTRILCLVISYFVYVYFEFCAEIRL